MTRPGCVAEILVLTSICENATTVFLLLLMFLLIGREKCGSGLRKNCENLSTTGA